MRSDRLRVREYYEDNPDASYREVAEVAAKLGASRQLVTKVVNSTNGSIIDHNRAKARPPG